MQVGRVHVEGVGGEITGEVQTVAAMAPGRVVCPWRCLVVGDGDRAGRGDLGVGSAAPRASKARASVMVGSMPCAVRVVDVPEAAQQPVRVGLTPPRLGDGLKLPHT